MAATVCPCLSRVSVQTESHLPGVRCQAITCRHRARRSVEQPGGCGALRREPSKCNLVILGPSTVNHASLPRAASTIRAHASASERASWCRNGMPSQRQTSGSFVGRAIGPAVPTGFILQARPPHSDANSRNPRKGKRANSLNSQARPELFVVAGRAERQGVRLIGTSKGVANRRDRRPVPFRPGRHWWAAIGIRLTIDFLSISLPRRPSRVVHSPFAHASGISRCAMAKRRSAEVRQEVKTCPG